MGGMEFTWRMASALAWPAVVIVGVLAFRGWITQRLDSLGITWGSLGVQLKALNTKVDQAGQDIAVTLSENVPQPAVGDEIPESLVDLLATVNRNRIEGIRAAFDLVYRALKENYPQLRRVLPSQLPEAMHDLVDKGEMEADVAMSVQQLYELMAMPEWEKDQAGDTRGYAFLMLAEGAIHGILRSAQARGTGSGEDPSARPPVPIRTSWRGTYNNSFPIQLNLATWSGSRFDGTMTYPDGDTVTSVTGTVEADADGARLTWKEQEYTRPGRRTIDFGGNYAATIRGDTMDGAWYQGTRRVASFTMTASSTSPTTSFPN
jgi:hypothetical protein